MLLGGKLPKSKEMLEAMRKERAEHHTHLKLCSYQDLPAPEELKT